MRSDNSAVARAQLKTPKVAGIAGIVSSILMIVIFWLLRRSIPADPPEAGVWLVDTKLIVLALNLIPFAGVAFLWFVGVLRDQLGQKEDRFFATVFFGSAILYLSMLFAAAAIVGAVTLVAPSANPTELINSTMFRLARATAYVCMNVYVIKMSAVVMISASTILLYTAIAPRWLAIVGYLLAFVVVLGSSYMKLEFHRIAGVGLIDEYLHIG